MPRVVAYEDVKAHQFGRRSALRTPFLEYNRDVPDLPVAFLSQGEPERVIKPHWHVVDEFLVIVGGKGKFGHHDVAPYFVHFASANTPYGPIVGGSQTGVSFFVLFPRFDPGAQYFPETLEKLKQIPDRRPWQITRQVKFPSQAGRALADAVDLQEVPDMKDDRGLFAYALTMPPNTETAAPDPARGNGQYLLVVNGSLWYENKEHKAYTVVFVEPNEGPFQLRAGAAGLEAMIMNFPRTKAYLATKPTPSAAVGLKKWQCELCAFAYDEALGLPDDGIPAGTRWEDVPESWTCPDCAAAKSDFKMVEVQ